MSTVAVAGASFRKASGCETELRVLAGIAGFVLLRGLWQAGQYWATRGLPLDRFVVINFDARTTCCNKKFQPVRRCGQNPFIHYVVEKNHIP